MANRSLKHENKVNRSLILNSLIICYFLLQFIFHIPFSQRLEDASTTNILLKQSNNTENNLFSYLLYLAYPE